MNSLKENLFITFLTKMQSELNSKSELLICQTILENIDTIQNLDIRELAALSGVSTATISRFVDEFPVKSYREFIHYLAVYHRRMNFTIEQNHSRVVKETMPGIYALEKNRAINNLAASKDSLDAAELQKLLWMINKANSVTIVGANHSLELFARVQAALFSTGKICYLYKQVEKCMAHIDTLKKDDLVIFVSVAGRYHNSHGYEICNQLKEKRTKCILITQARTLNEHDFNLVIHYGINGDRNAGYYSLEALTRVLAQCISKDPS